LFFSSETEYQATVQLEVVLIIFAVVAGFVLLSNKADESLKSINTAVNTILEMNTDIAISVDKQSSVADNINKNIVSINQVAEETVLGSEQTAASSEELAGLASHLQSMVGRFKTS